MILRCTKRLLDVIRPEQLATAEPGADNWYANLLVLDRSRCLLLTHAGTLFTVFEPDVRASDLRSIHNLVVGLIERQLLAESLPPGTFGDLRTTSLRIAKTADRSVLGCMNDMAFLCEVAVADAGGWPATKKRLGQGLRVARPAHTPAQGGAHPGAHPERDDPAERACARGGQGCARLGAAQGGVPRKSPRNPSTEPSVRSRELQKPSSRWACTPSNSVEK